jgi:NADH dehydrogenase
MQWLWRYLTYERGARLIAVEHAETPGARSSPVPRAQPRPVADAARKRLN